MPDRGWPDNFLFKIARNDGRDPGQGEAIGSIIGARSTLTVQIANHDSLSILCVWVKRRELTVAIRVWKLSAFYLYHQIEQLLRNTKIVFGLVLKGSKLGKNVFQSVQFNRRKIKEVDIISDVLAMAECARLVL